MGADTDRNDNSQQSTITKINQDAFLAAFAVSGTLKSAAEAIDIPRATIHAWARKDTHGFKVRYTEATEIFREYLQDIAVDRVKNQKPNDNPVLLITLLNAHWPEKYRRDAHYADNAAKEVMAEWKRFVKANKKAARNSRDDKSEQDTEREQAVAEAQKILARKANDNQRDG
jgi:hypothetical protein